MLVVTRSTGDEIVIDDDIRITVTMVKGDRVRLGITAPESVRVVRGELLERRVESGTSLLPPCKHQP
jgi:carbon storage regulator